MKEKGWIGRDKPVEFMLVEQLTHLKIISVYLKQSKRVDFRWQGFNTGSTGVSPK